MMLATAKACPKSMPQAQFHGPLLLVIYDECFVLTGSIGPLYLAISRLCLGEGGGVGNQDSKEGCMHKGSARFTELQWQTLVRRRISRAFPNHYRHNNLGTLHLPLSPW